MPSRSLLPALALVAALVLAGCLGTPQEDAANDPAPTPGDGPVAPPPVNTPPATTPSEQNGAPTAALHAANVFGPAPLTVTFTINGTDPDGDGLAWEVDFDGDNTTDRTDSMAVTSFTWNYTAAGNYTARLIVSDGEAEAFASAAIVVTAPAVPTVPEPIRFEGVITGLYVAPVEGFTYVPTINNHTFDLAVPVANISASIAFGATAFDLDFWLVAPNGTVVDTSANYDAPADPVGVLPIGPITGPGESDVGTTDPAFTSSLGQWTVRVAPGLAVEGAYVVTVSFA